MADVKLKKQQMEYIGIGALVLIALFIGITRFKKGDKEDEVFSRTEFNRKWQEVEILEKTVPKEEKGINYIIEVERLPFKGPFEGEQEVELAGSDIDLPAMKFQGMVWNSLRPQAIINNKVYDVDDTIEVGIEDSIKIKDITKDGIYLRYKGREFIVSPK